jgi:hypothetical protein
VVVKGESDHGGSYSNYDDQLHAIDPQNPEQDRWVNGSQQLLGPASISAEGNIYLYNRREGASWWRGYLLGFDSQGNFLENWPIEDLGAEASLLVIDKEENIYGWFGDTNSIKAFNPNDEELWSVYVGKIHGRFFSLGSDETLYVGGQNKKLYAIKTSTNHPPIPPKNLFQLKSDSETVIPVGGTTDERTVSFRGIVSDPDGDKVKLQVELRNLNEYGRQFDETKGGLKDSDFVETGSEAVASAIELIDEDYHWRARAVDEHGEPSAWVDFGGNDISEADFTVAGITYSYDPQAAVTYAETWWNDRNSEYEYYGDYDCANFVSQCLIAGGLDLSEHPEADSEGCIPTCTNLHDYLVNYLGVTGDTRFKGEEEPSWFVPGDPAIFGYTDKEGKVHLYAHAVIAVTKDDSRARCNAHSDNKHQLSIQQFYDNYSNLDRCTFYHIPGTLTPAKPVLTSPLRITPEKDTYYVGDTLTAEFTITNIGDVPITLDKLLVGGRYNSDDGKLPNGEFPDFTFQSETLQPNSPHQYTGTLELTHPGNYQFFIAYYIENPKSEEKKLLDENNWNTCVNLGEGLTDEDRTEDIVVEVPSGEFLVEVNDPNGVDIYIDSSTASVILKHAPIGGVLKRIDEKTIEGTGWWKLEDVDGIIGWAQSEYLTYDQSKQGEWKEKTKKIIFKDNHPDEFTFENDLYSGMANNDEVRLLQAILKEEPSYERDGEIIIICPEGLITGIFGPLTEEAVIRFQEKYATDILEPLGLTEGTGFVGEKTREKLNELLSDEIFKAKLEKNIIWITEEYLLYVTQ